ncbi:hypothetical protein Tco_0714287 [Tanacetum coccineum]
MVVRMRWWCYGGCGGGFGGGDGEWRVEESGNGGSGKIRINDHVKIGMSNFRIALEKTQPDPIYKVCLEIPKQFSVYNAFIATADAPEIYMQ